MAAGCQGGHPVAHPTSLPAAQLRGLEPLTPVESVVALCDPPLNWKPDPLEKDSRHTHQVWISPSGKTAYGVIHFGLPLPVGQNIVLWQFVREMRNTTGKADLLEKQNDPGLPGIRFVVENDTYLMRVNLIVEGFDGWAIYAGTMVTKPVADDELGLAQRARDNTVVGLPQSPPANHLKE